MGAGWSLSRLFRESSFIQHTLSEHLLCARPWAQLRLDPDLVPAEPCQHLKEKGKRGSLTAMETNPSVIFSKSTSWLFVFSVETIFMLCSFSWPHGDVK